MLFSRMAGFLMLVGIAALAGTGAWAHPDAGAAGRARLLMNSGLAHERLGQNEDALVDFTQALATKALSRDDRVRAIFDRGVALDALGRTRDAIGDYAEAIRLEPAFAPALNNRANAYRRLGRLNEAKRDYLAALACHNVAREYPYYGLGQIAEKLGDIDSARDYYSKALTANPTYALAAQTLAALHRATSPAVALRPPSVKQAQSSISEPTPIVLRAPAVAHAPQTEEAKLVRVAQRGPDLALRQAILDSGARKLASDSPSAQIQLGAFHDQATATEAWSKILAGGGGSLQGLSPLIIPVDLPGKGRLWRLRTAVNDKATARRLCAELATHGLACTVARD